MEGSRSVVKKKSLIFIDTNVFVIDLRYKNDSSFGSNRAFLDYSAAEKNGVTGIINLLEVCGILSYNLNDRQLLELFHYFPVKYGVEVVPSVSHHGPFPPLPLEGILTLIIKKMSFGDALILSNAEYSAAQAEYFISWDASHFKDKTDMETMTPEEFMRSIPSRFS